MKKMIALLFTMLVILGAFAGCRTNNLPEETKEVESVMTEPGWEWGTPTPDD